MDDGLTGPPSKSECSVTQFFDEAAPWYLSIGMPLEQFWDGDPKIAICYRKAEEHRLRSRERELWRQGLYLQCAIASAFSESVRYPDRPEPVTREEAERRRRLEEQEALEKEKQQLFLWAETCRNREEGADGNRD